MWGQSSFVGPGLFCGALPVAVLPSPAHRPPTDNPPPSIPLLPSSAAHGLALAAGHLPAARPAAAVEPPARRGARGAADQRAVQPAALLAVRKSARSCQCCFRGGAWAAPALASLCPTLSPLALPAPPPPPPPPAATGCTSRWRTLRRTPTCAPSSSTCCRRRSGITAWRTARARGAACQCRQGAAPAPQLPLSAATAQPCVCPPRERVRAYVPLERESPEPIPTYVLS